MKNEKLYVCHVIAQASGGDCHASLAMTEIAAVPRFHDSTISQFHGFHDINI